jgi:iron complex transport system permease protein
VSVVAPLHGRVVRRGRLSVRVGGRTVATSGVLIALIAGVGCWSISVGDFPISVGDVVRTLFGAGSSDSDFIVNTLRLPRALTAVLVGGAFGISGAVFQSLTRNPLGSPDVIGFNHGAALGAVFTIVAFDGARTVEVAAGAGLGGIATAAVVYLCAWKRGVQPYRLVLVGIGIGFALSAGTEYLLTRASIYDAQRAYVWLTGSLNGRGWEHVWLLGATLLVLLPATVWLTRSLRLLEMGDDAAAALGVRVGRSRLALATIGVFLAALATAAAGPIAFVALMSPPIARRLVRGSGATIVPAALVGALLTLGADLVARRVAAPTELPVGVATAALGGPYLLFLLARGIKAGAM